MKLYNTLTRLKEEFVPGVPPQATIYACGPTVYNFAHIGNLRTYIFEDTLKRVLASQGFAPKHVMNVTDVGHLVSDDDAGEDKMELGSQREGKTAWEIARFYEKAFFEGFTSLNCRMPDVVCRATEHIPEMIALVQKLEAGGYTYKTGDGIYFDTSKFPQYYRLAGKSHIEGLKAGARVQFSEEKRNTADFALWKFSPQGKKRQMEWPSPWGTGFPGWHIECSAMAMKHLGETIDMHCGGEDHVAIHHTNEIAQSEAATGKPFANYWMHGRFLVMGDTGKMSKSAGGFITTSTLPEKGYDPLAYRYYCLLTHYRKQLEFSWAGVEAAARGLDGLRSLAARVKAEAGASGPAPAADRNAKFFITFAEALADDVNLPEALAVLWETLKDASVPAPRRLAFALAAEEVLALNLFSGKPEGELPAELAALIKDREAARKARDFKRSDELRKALSDKGVLIEDTPEGTTWKFSRG